MNSNMNYNHNHGYRQVPLVGDQFEISLTTVKLKKKQPDVRFYATSVVNFTNAGAVLHIHHKTRDITKSDRIIIEEGCTIETNNGYKANVIGVQHLGRPMTPYIEVESEDLLELFL